MKDESKEVDHLPSGIVGMRKPGAKKRKTASKLKRSEKDLLQHISELEFLNHLGQKFSSSLHLSEILAAVLEEVRQMLGAAACSIWLTDPKTDELFCKQATGASSEAVLGWRLKPREGIAGWVVHSGQSLIVKDTRAEKRHFKEVDRKTGTEIRCILGVPLRIRKKVIGVIEVLDTKVDSFSKSDIALMESLAGSAGIAMENARLYEELEQELTERKQTEVALRKRETELTEKSKRLEEANAALKVLLERIEQDKRDIQNNVLSNIKQLVFPSIERLKKSELDPNQISFVNILESNLQEVVSPFVSKLSSSFFNLSPTEIKVASLVRDGRTTKEIADLLHLSENTILTHRYHIRSKLGLKNRKANLRSYLRTLHD
jgi:GAF domain-containing protein/DNA-binding CsgD family transcriptional regulator